MSKFVIAGGILGLWLAASGPAVIAAQANAQILPPARTVHIKNFRFDPTPFQIHAGDRVTFVNDDTQSHTATADGKSFASEALDSDSTRHHALMKPRKSDYFCKSHPYMEAPITVLPAASGVGQ